MIRVKTTDEWITDCSVEPDRIVGICLDGEELLEKQLIFADWGGEDSCYFGGTARVIYHYFFNQQQNYE